MNDPPTLTHCCSFLADLDILHLRRQHIQPPFGQIEQEVKLFWVEIGLPSSHFDIKNQFFGPLWGTSLLS